jgi:predicted N-acetyltransferase YhbS
MDMSKNIIELATVNDFDEVKALLNKANDYSKDRSGYRLWTVMDYVYGQLEEQLASKTIYVLRNQQTAIVATIGISEKTGHWEKFNDKKSALYLTKLMKDPEAAPNGIGCYLLNFAARKALIKNKPLLRCDTVSELDGLIKYYMSFGFKPMGNFTYKSSGRPGILLQADAASALGLTGSRFES